MDRRATTSHHYFEDENARNRFNRPFLCERTVFLLLLRSDEASRPLPTLMAREGEVKSCGVTEAQRTIWTKAPAIFGVEKEGRCRIVARQCRLRNRMIFSGFERFFRAFRCVGMVFFEARWRVLWSVACVCSVAIVGRGWVFVCGYIVHDI